MTIKQVVCACACGYPIFVGDLVYESVDGGLLHAECCGEPESFVDSETGDHLKAGDPLPQPFPASLEP